VNVDGEAATVNLYWLPLGAGGRSVRWNGRVFEWIAAHREHRSRYEVRRWQDGPIRDADEAPDIQCIGDDHDRAQRLLELGPQVPP